MKKRFVFLAKMICLLVLTWVFIGCDLNQKKEIDQKFQGKWETQSLVSRGTTYNFPVILNDVQVNSRGWLIDSKSIKGYHNGTVVTTINDVYSDSYSDGSVYFLQIADDAQIGIEMKVTGNTAEISLSLVSDNCKKVSKFSWE